MNFTLSSLLTVLIFSNLAILLFHYIINSAFLYYKFAFPILFVLFCMVMIRLFIPLELSTQQNIFIYHIWPPIYLILIENRFTIAQYSFSILTVLAGISILGTLLLLVRNTISYIRTLNYVKSSTPLSLSSDDLQFMKEINTNFKKPVFIPIVVNPSVRIPFLIGLVHPIIVLPQIAFTKQELYYIYFHEACHYHFKDLWIRFTGEILCSLYWWNPFIYMLRKNMISYQELRVDTYITRHTSELQQYEYIKCLISLSQYSMDNLSPLSTAFNSTQNITCRVKYLLNCHHISTEEPKYQTKRLTCFCTFILLLLAMLLPNRIIFEPSSPAPSDIQQTTFSINSGNSYLLLNNDQTYDLYVDGEYLTTVSQVFDDALPIIKPEDMN